MTRRLSLAFAIFASLSIVLGLSGCSSAGGGKGFGSFSNGHRLTDDVDAFRQVNRGPLQIARELGEGATVATILCDRAERYFSTPLFEEDL